MKGHAKADGIVEMRLFLPIVVEGKGADADEPHQSRVAKVLPEGPKAILLDGLEALLGLDLGLFADVDQAEDVEEAADGAGHKDGGIQVDHDGPVAG